MKKIISPTAHRFPLTGRVVLRHLLKSCALTACLLMSGCEPKEIFADEYVELTPGGQQEIIRVAPDDGVTRVNSLPKAIAANGDGIYELERDGVYYLEGKNVIGNNIVVRAAQGTGAMPMIQPISDEQGALNSDMLRFEGNATFQNIYFNGRDAASANNIMQRLFRIDKGDLRIRFEGCFVEYCRNFCIRTDNKNTKLYIHNSTFRNLALTSDPANGRLFDSRGNAQDTISITNSTICNMTAHIVRFDGAIMNYFEFKKNTVYNVGQHFRVDYAMTSVIEDNIFANVGWKASYTADNPGAFWEIRKFDEGGQYDPGQMKAYIRNNNVYTSPEIKTLYVKYPGNIERVPLNAAGLALKEAGQLIYENNIAEELAFDNPPPLPMSYIDKFFEVLNTGMSAWADLPFYVDENGVDGFTNGVTFTFNYPASSASATASTTGGALGAETWKRF